MRIACLIGRVPRRFPEARGQCSSARSMAPPLARIRGLPSSGDSSFLPSVHESVADTSLTMIGQDLSPRSSTNRPQQSEQVQRSEDQDQRPECSATSSIIQDPASHLSTSRDSHGLEASHSSSSSPAALPEVASRPRGLLPKCRSTLGMKLMTCFEFM